jgi:hypothetical protein
MNKPVIFAILLVAFLPASVLADSADDDWWDDDDDQYYCSDLCARATTECNTPCAPSAYNECLTFCEENLDQYEIDCVQNTGCTSFNECLCDVDDDDSDDDDATTDDDAQADDDTQSGDEDNTSSDDDDDDGLFCSVSSGERNAALTLFMLAVGIVAFFISLRPKRSPR